MEMVSPAVLYIITRPSPCEAMNPACESRRPNSVLALQSNPMPMYSTTCPAARPYTGSRDSKLARCACCFPLAPSSRLAFHLSRPLSLSRARGVSRF